MPPVARGAHGASFVALWVEDLVAKLWSIEMESGAADEIARFSIEGMTRPQILELARQFARARQGRRTMHALLGESEVAEPERAPAPRKAKAKRKPRTQWERDVSSGLSHKEVMAAQKVRQADLYAALVGHGELGVTSAQLSDELGRSGPSGTGVSLGILERAGKARLDRDTGLWYALTNGDAQ